MAFGKKGDDPFTLGAFHLDSSMVPRFCNFEVYFFDFSFVDIYETMLAYRTLHYLVHCFTSLPHTELLFFDGLIVLYPNVSFNCKMRISYINFL